MIALYLEHSKKGSDLSVMDQLLRQLLQWRMAPYWMAIACFSCDVPIKPPL